MFFPVFFPAQRRLGLRPVETQFAEFLQHIAYCARTGSQEQTRYDAEAVRRFARRRGYTPHIRSRGEEQIQCRRSHRARRWVVERIHSWLNRYRRILIRWEKKAANYVGLLHLVFAHVLWRNS